MTFRTFIISSGFLLVGLNSCKVRSKAFWKEEHQKVEGCRSKWKYPDLKEEKSIRVLYSHGKYNRCMLSFPSFIIGVTSEMDTVGVFDGTIDTTYTVGDMITVIPAVTERRLGMETQTPLFVVSYDRKENDLHCSVRNVYHVRIKK